MKYVLRCRWLILLVFQVVLSAQPPAASTQLAQTNTTAPAVELPDCDPAFAQGMSAIIVASFAQPHDRLAASRAVLDCIANAHLQNATDESIARQAFRFAYDHRKDEEAIMLSPGIIADEVRKSFGVSPTPFAIALMPYLGSPDVDVRRVAQGMLELSGTLNVYIDETGRKLMPGLEALLRDLKPVNWVSLSPEFVRMVFSRAPELAWGAFSPFDELGNEATRQDLKKPKGFGIGQRELVNYIMWASTQARRDVGPEKVDKPLVTVLLNDLSKSTFRSDRLFVLGMMNQYPLNGSEKPVLFDDEILKRLEADSDPLLKSVAKCVREDLDHPGGAGK